MGINLIFCQKKNDIRSRITFITIKPTINWQLEHLGQCSQQSILWMHEDLIGSAHIEFPFPSDFGFRSSIIFQYHLYPRPRLLECQLLEGLWQPASIYPSFLQIWSASLTQSHHQLLGRFFTSKIFLHHSSEKWLNHHSWFTRQSKINYLFPIGYPIILVA